MERYPDTTQLDATTGDATLRAHATTEKLAARAHETVDNVSHAAHRVADRLSANGEHLVASGDQALESMREYVRERPIAALATALTVGFLLSRLTR